MYNMGTKLRRGKTLRKKRSSGRKSLRRKNQRKSLKKKSLRNKSLRKKKIMRGGGVGDIPEWYENYLHRDYSEETAKEWAKSTEGLSSADISSLGEGSTDLNLVANNRLIGDSYLFNATIGQISNEDKASWNPLTWRNQATPADVKKENKKMGTGNTPSHASVARIYKDELPIVGGMYITGPKDGTQFDEFLRTARFFYARSHILAKLQGPSPLDENYRHTKVHMTDYSFLECTEASFSGHQISLPDGYQGIQTNSKNPPSIEEAQYAIGSKPWKTSTPDIVDVLFTLSPKFFMKDFTDGTNALTKALTKALSHKVAHETLSFEKNDKSWGGPRKLIYQNQSMKYNNSFWSAMAPEL
jgi:hypothetical protein